jgi:anti-sigma regulatory factor (Ser/Thr protein kinase)
VADEITLTLPAEEGFEGVAHLVLGGLAARLELTVESLEDLQIAVDALIDCCADDDEVTVVVVVDGSRLRTTVGPFGDGALDALEHDDSPLGLRRVLETVCSSFEVEHRDHAQWVQLTTSVEREP